MSNVLKHFWDKTVTFKNRLTSEYLFADAYVFCADYYYDENRPYIFTAVNKEKVPGKGEWILKHEADDGEKLLLKNKYYSEYLYCEGEMYECTLRSPRGISASGSSNVFGSEFALADRLVFTWTGKSYCSLEPVPGVPDHFLIKNMQLGEYLFNETTPLLNSERRVVYTSGSIKGSIVKSLPECHWEMKLAD